MPGRQLDFAIRGAQYEKAFDAIASHLMSVVRTPRPEDYGIDAFCHLRFPVDDISMGVLGTFGVQVRGPGCKLEFGGLKDGKPRHYEVLWLRTLAVPLYLARVSKDCCRVDFYSTAPLALVLGQSLLPFRIICEFQDETKVPFEALDPSKEQAGDDSFGDKTVWTVNLGPPFLSVSLEQLRDPVFVANAGNLLRLWTELHRVTQLRLTTGIVVTESLAKWSTNDFDFSKPRQTKHFMAWSPIPGQNLETLASVLEPVITVLGVHLQWQRDMGAYALLPVLDWLENRKQLSAFGKRLRDNLELTQESGKAPEPT